MQNTTKSRIKTAFICVAIVALIFVPAYFLVFSHDVYLWQLGRALSAVKHPPQTKRIATYKNLGLLVGNGDHCDYVVAEFRSYDNLSTKEITKFYKDTQIWNPLNRRNEKITVGVIQNDKLETIQTHEDSVIAPDVIKDYFDNHLRRQVNRKLYFILFFDVGYGTGCDVRCM